MSPARGDSWDEFAEGIRELEGLIAQSGAKTVRSKKTRTSARVLAQQFLREVRPHLVELGIPEDTLAQFDTPVRELLQFSHQHAERGAYGTHLTNLRRLHGEIGPLRETKIGTQAGASMPGVAVVTSTEGKIIKTLESLKFSAAHSYQQALVDLSGPARHSYRGVAHELREALRETLDHFAPDADVMAEPGFQLEKGLTRPTQRQKALHVLLKRRISRDARQAPELAVSAIEELSASITRSTYTRGAMSAHGITGATEVRQMKMYVDAVLAELLEIHQERQS